MASERELCWQILRANPTGFMKIVCRDGEQIHAELLEASEDMDGSRHVVFDVMWSTRPELYAAHRGCGFYSSFDEISAAEPLPREKGTEYLNARSNLRS